MRIVLVSILSTLLLCGCASWPTSIGAGSYTPDDYRLGGRLNRVYLDHQFSKQLDKECK